jgi:hypothetical protein
MKPDKTPEGDPVEADETKAYEPPVVEDLPRDEPAVVAAGTSKSPPTDGIPGPEWRP